MSRPGSQFEVSLAKDDVIVLPAGTPDWITPELVKKTIEVWQPYYPELLTLEEAVTMIQSVGRLYQALSSGASS
ncbi:MAG: hypothetical protein ACKOAU_16245 [Pirellula sp.]